MKGKPLYKKIFGWLHLYLGLASGIVVLIVATTGCIYVFEQEYRNIFQHKYFHVRNIGVQRMPLQQMKDSFVAHFPKEKITSIRFKEAKDAAFIFINKGGKAASIDPYTSKIIGVRNLKNDFLENVRELHTHLMMGDAGSQIVKWNVLIFFLMVVSGLVLWWPKQRKFFSQAMRINFKTKNWKRLNWDLHSVLGFYASTILLVISLTGMFWMFDAAKQLVSLVTHSPITKKEDKFKLKPIKGRIFPIDSAYAYVAANYPGAQETIITMPADSASPIRVLMRYPYTIVRKQNSVYFDRYTGSILKSSLYINNNGYDKIAASNYDLHTGGALGIGSKIIYFLASFMAASLPITGFMVWWNRNKKTKKPNHIKTMLTAT